MSRPLESATFAADFWPARVTSASRDSGVGPINSIKLGPLFSCNKLAVAQFQLGQPAPVCLPTNWLPFSSGARASKSTCSPATCSRLVPQNEQVAWILVPGRRLGPSRRRAGASSGAPGKLAGSEPIGGPGGGANEIITRTHRPNRRPKRVRRICRPARLARPMSQTGARPARRTSGANREAAREHVGSAH